MLSDLVAFLLVCVSACCVVCVNGRICPSLDIRNQVADLEKLRNCTTILGNLKILLMELHPDGIRDPYHGISFPELTEVTGFVMLFKLHKLRTMSNLFPNLRIIRGHTLVGDYAFVIYFLEDLEEIGLYNLAYIERGGVWIDSNPKLCYYDTIDWYAIGASDVVFADNDEHCGETCDPSCNGYCWNTDHCQMRNSEDCHTECISCTKPHSAKHCVVCKHYRNDDECVKECPSNRLINEQFKQCVTKEECYNTEDGRFLVFGNKCISECPPKYKLIGGDPKSCRSCGDDCVTYCEGMVVNSISTAQKLYGCTHVRGSLEIRVYTENVVPVLDEYLSSIRYIDGCLKVGRSGVLNSLGFLSSLRVINGANLETNYALFVYENENLKRLWNFTNFTLVINNGSIAFHNNPQLCLSEIDTLIKITKVQNVSDIDVSKYSNGNEALCNVIDMKINVTVTPTTALVSWEEPQLAETETIVGYSIFYTNSTAEVDPMESKTFCGVNNWESVFVSENTYLVRHLGPFTEYAYHIKVYTTQIALQSRTDKFVTLSAKPSEVLDFRGVAVSHNTIRLRWKPPEKLNGQLAYYSLVIYTIEDSESYLAQRNYCRQPMGHLSHTSEQYNFTMVERECCMENKAISAQVSDIEIPLLRNIRSNIDEGGENYHLMPYANDEVMISNDKMDRRSVFESVSTSVFEVVSIYDPNATSYEVTGLKYFRKYAFWLSACNLNENKTPQCGVITSAFARTSKLDVADDIANLTLRSVVSSSVELSWQEPRTPNVFIVAYHVEYKKNDIKHAQSTIDCVTRADFLLHNGVFTMHKMMPGNYKVRVQAISLAGGGRFSDYITFEIHAESVNHQWLPIVLAILVIVLIAGAVVYFFWYRRRIKLGNIHLITTINPDYAGPMYVEDEWEISRDDLDINEREIGHGIFGKVFTGIIKPRNMPCAIKTVNDTASYSMRMDFLNEASVMKSFSTAHHVVRLLGVVSKCQPPLVVMELMERGDLKTFLRRTRDSSQDITSNEIYRMAAEIADGMAYLAAKKFVHRDLAARNCMIAYDRTVKIGDFGMARDIYETDYYRKESRGLLPVRWMAPESLADGVFTSDSDVWGYGIVLWEIATLAEQPYQGLSNEQVLHFVTTRGKLERPSECPDLLYEIMSRCWKWRPSDRPLFTDIVQVLEKCVGESFKLVSFYHTQEGRDHRMNARERAYNQPALDTTETSHLSRYKAYDESVDLYLDDEEPERLLPYANQTPNIRVNPSSSRRYRSSRDGF